MKRILLLLYLFFVSGVACALEKSEAFETVTLKSLDCSIEVPAGWKVYDQSYKAGSAWVITPDDLNEAHYDTGVRIDSISQVKNKTGSVASKWVADRIKNKSTSLQVLSADSGSKDDYFKVKSLVTEEVYSPGRDIYTTYLMRYTWFWNDDHDFVVFMVSRAPKNAWKKASSILERVEKLNFNESEWKKKLEKVQNK